MKAGGKNKPGSKIQPLFGKYEHGNPKETENMNLGVKYMSETSLHCVKYIVEKDRHVIERIFWAIMSSVCWFLAVYLIYQVSFQLHNSAA